MAINYDINIIAKDNASRVLSRVEQNLNKIGSSPGATNAATGLTSITRIAGPAALAVTAVATAMTAVSKSAIDATKQFENYRNRLSLVTNSSTELASTMTRLQGLAVQNRTSFADTVDLYSKLSSATENLGYSTAQVEELTTKMSQALAVAGADAGTASGVIRQFGQAMNSGVVRGDEFNSIVEGLGPALAIMARESGRTVGELRALAADGKLSSQAFAEMLLNSTALGESFQKMQPTISDLEQASSDAFGRMMVRIGELSGVTETYRFVLRSLPELFDKVAVSLTPQEQALAEITKLQAELTRLTEQQAAGQTTVENGVSRQVGLLQNQRRLMDNLVLMEEVRARLQAEGDAKGVEYYNEQILLVQSNLNKLNSTIKSNGQTTESVIAATQSKIDGYREAYFMLEAAARRASQNDEFVRATQEAANAATAAERQLTEARTAAQTAAQKVIEANSGLLNSENANTQAILANAAAYEAVKASLADRKNLTEQQVLALEDLKLSLYDTGEQLMKFGEHYTLLSSVTTGISDAINRNRSEFEALTAVQAQLRTQIQSNVFDNEILRAEMAAVSAAIADNRNEYSQLTGTIQDTGGNLSQFEQYYRQLLETAGQAVTSQTNMSLAVNRLSADLAAGIINLDQYAAAMASLNAVSTPTRLEALQGRLAAMREEAAMNPILIGQLKELGEVSNKELIALGLMEPARRASTAAKREELSASEQLAKQLGEERLRWENLNATLSDTSAIEALAKKYGVSADIISRQLTKARDSIDTFQTSTITASGIIKSTWEEMSKSMASGIAQGIMAGKGAFNSFADFLKDFANRVLTQILEKMLIQPMIDQMSNMFMGTNIQVPTLGQQMGGGGGLLGGLFGGGAGGGGGLFGGIGNFFSGLWGGISNFFGGLFGGFFASGGYLPSNKLGVVGEAGPELITGPANITPMGEGGGGALVVNFNINVIDPSTGTQFILEHKHDIEGVIQNAYNRRGKAGIY